MWWPVSKAAAARSSPYAKSWWLGLSPLVMRPWLGWSDQRFNRF